MGGAGIAAGGFGVYDLRPVLRTTAVARVRAALEKEPCEFRLVANYRSFERGQCVHIIRSSSCPLPLVRVCTPVKQDPGEVVVSALAGPIKRSQETALAAQSRASLLTPAAPSQPWQTVRQLVSQQRPSSSSPTQPSRTRLSESYSPWAAPPSTSRSPPLAPGRRSIGRFPAPQPWQDVARLKYCIGISCTSERNKHRVTIVALGLLRTRGSCNAGQECLLLRVDVHHRR